MVCASPHIRHRHPRLKMVMTRGKDDEKALYDLLGNKDERKKFDTQFKKAESNFKIAIVVDMWLAGFDVPFLDTMLTPSRLLGRACGPALWAVHLACLPTARFIDKPVQRHNLIQTISLLGPSCEPLNQAHRKLHPCRNFQNQVT